MKTQPLRIKPDFIIVGAMKCATSTLHDQLKKHTSFFMTTPKEPNFFSDDDNYSKGNVWYESLFEHALPGQLKGESSTHYTKLPTYPKTIDRLAYHCPEIKCIYIMRDPIERLISHYIHEWTQRVINSDINEAIGRFSEMIDYGCYAMQIEPYISKFGPDKILPVFVERIKKNPEHELKIIFNFLRVSEPPIWHEDVKQNVSSERLRKSEWRDVIVNNQVLTSFRRSFIPKKFRNYVKSFWTIKERPELSDENIKYITGIFNNDLKKLGKMLDIELDYENYREVILHADEINWKNT